MAGDEAGTVEPDRVDADRFGQDTLVRQDMAAIVSSVRLAPERMAMEERRAVALAEGQRPRVDPGDAVRAEGLAVEGGMLRGRRQRRHDIGEGREREPGRQAQHAAGEALRGEGFGDRVKQKAGFQLQRELVAMPLGPLDALGIGRAWLLDRPHAEAPGVRTKSSRPRFSNSSRTSRFGTLP